MDIYGRYLHGIWITSSVAQSLRQIPSFARHFVVLGRQGQWRQTEPSQFQGRFVNGHERKTFLDGFTMVHHGYPWMYMNLPWFNGLVCPELSWICAKKTCAKCMITFLNCVFHGQLFNCLYISGASSAEGLGRWGRRRHGDKAALAILLGGVRH